MNATKEYGTYKPKIKADQKQGIFSREFLGVKKQQAVYDTRQIYELPVCFCNLLVDATIAQLADGSTEVPTERLLNQLPFCLRQCK